MKKVSATICAITMFLNALLHIALIFGAPLGEFVLGGQYVVFPFMMRMVSVFYAFLWAFIGFLYLKLAGFIRIPMSQKLMTILLIFNTGFLVHGIYANLYLTESIKETYLMTPLCIITSLCSIIALVGNRNKNSI